MRKSTTCVLLALLMVFAVSSVSSGIVQVAKRYSFIEVYGGYSEAVGTYSGISVWDFTDDYDANYELDGNQVYDPAMHLGLNLGQLRGGNMAISIGFKYTKINQLTEIPLGIYDLVITPKPNINVYDFAADFDYYFMNPIENLFSPYVGVGALVGMTVATNEGYNTENEFGAAFAVDAGFDFRFYHNKTTGNTISLTPRVSYEFYASGNRAKHLNIGGGLKYYMR